MTKDRHDFPEPLLAERGEGRGGGAGGLVIYSNVSLCCVPVLPRRAACTHQQLGLLPKKENKGKKKKAKQGGDERKTVSAGGGIEGGKKN